MLQAAGRLHEPQNGDRWERARDFCSWGLGERGKVSSSGPLPTQLDAGGCEIVHDQDWPCSALGLAGDRAQTIST